MPSRCRLTLRMETRCGARRALQTPKQKPSFDFTRSSGMPMGSVSSTIRSSRVGDWVERQEPLAMDQQMKDDLAKNEMRIAAIEYLLCQLWVNSMKFGGITEQEFAWRTDGMLTNLNKQAFPGSITLLRASLKKPSASCGYTKMHVGISETSQGRLRSMNRCSH